jgi:uncharacterized protein
MKLEILGKAKDEILKIEPSAEIILYGSRMCNLLVLVDGEVDDNRTHRVCRQLHEIEGNTGETLRGIVSSRSIWEDPQSQGTPLFKNIRLEGITI